LIYAIKHLLTYLRIGWGLVWVTGYVAYTRSAKKAVPPWIFF